MNTVARGALTAGTTGQMRAIAIAMASALAADGLLIFLAATGQGPVELILALHLCVGPAVWLATRRSGEVTLPAIAALSITILGPVGALGTLLLGVILARSKAGHGATSDWYVRLASPSQVDLSERVSDTIVEGRMREPGQTTLTSFHDIAREGSISQRQIMLGLMSQRFDPSYAGLLRQSLKSEDAAVRVSAAAVFSKLREVNRKQMDVGKSPSDVLSRNQAAQRGLALAKGLMSGLLDPADSVSVCNESLSFLLTARPSITVADELEEVICTLLYWSGRISDLSERIAGFDVSDSAVVRDLKARLLMRSGRHHEVGNTILSRQSRSVRMYPVRLNKGHALLAPSGGDER